MVFDKHADVVAQHQLEFPQYYPHPGWHEHDADEIQQHADACIEGAVKELEKAGWAKESVTVIGEYSVFLYGLGLSHDDPSYL